jgi:hypothetical protein
MFMPSLIRDPLSGNYLIMNVVAEPVRDVATALTCHWPYRWSPSMLRRRVPDVALTCLMYRDPPRVLFTNTTFLQQQHAVTAVGEKKRGALQLMTSG